jgi:hypothetical protein
MAPRALSGSFTSWARRVAEGAVWRRGLASAKSSSVFDCFTGWVCSALVSDSLSIKV